MNFLAHLYLSGDDEEIIVGNFIADHVKGKKFQNYSPGIQDGILLHRSIDSYTDAHPIFIKSKDRLATKYRKYAGVITDMFYDHFLSAEWSLYHPETIDAFTRRMYAILLKKFRILPPRTKRMLPFMAKDNWLKGYGSLEGIDMALKGMDRRTPFNSGMGEAVSDLRMDYDLFRDEFHRFFPEIIRYTSQIRN
jgi:acyl carrier protein phosphodiesterase